MLIVPFQQRSYELQLVAGLRKNTLNVVVPLMVCISVTSVIVSALVALVLEQVKVKNQQHLRRTNPRNRSNENKSDMLQVISFKLQVAVAEVIS